MRLTALALALTVLAPAARAQTVQDRYDAAPPGPPPSAGASLRGPKSAGPIRTSYLTWTGKVDPMRGAQGDPDGLRGPALLDTTTGRAVRGATPSRGPAQPPPSALRPALLPQGAPPPRPAQPPPRVAESAPPPRMAPPPPQPSQRLPSSLYDQGYAAPVQAPPPSAQAQPPAAAPPTPLAGASPTQAQPQAQTAAAGESGPRYYSLHREYGLTPDPIPPAAPSVLALSPTVAGAMAGDKDDGPPIDLAGEDQANANPPPHQYNNPYANTNGSSSAGTTTTNANGQTTTTYVVKQ